MEATGIEEFRPGCNHLVNVGSVGQPRDHVERACYVIYRREKKDVLFVRVPYHVARAQEAVQAAGLPPFYGQRLSLGR